MRISDWSSDVCSSDLNRGHMETGYRLIGFEHPDHIDFSGRQPDLLIRLAKGGRNDAAVLRVDATAGESHLPGMPPERVGAPRQNERGPGVLDNGHQHRRSDDPPARWQAVGKISRQKLGRLGMGHLKHMPDLLDKRSEEHTSEL